MATKVEVQAAIEAIGIAVANATKVAAALTESSTSGGTESPIQTADILITPLADQALRITTRPGIDKIDWTIVSNVAPTYPWYPNALKKNVEVTAGGITVKPGYLRDGDFVKVGYNGGNWIDGPKNTKANTKAPAQPAGSNPIANWKLGANVERGNPGFLQYNGQKLTQPLFYKEYMPAVGLNWVRMFTWFGTEKDMGINMNETPDPAIFGQLITASMAASGAGIGVSLGLTDVLEAWSVDSRWDAVVRHVRNMARMANDRLDPNMVVLETANELGGGDNGFWNPKRMQLHEVIRQEAPQFWIAHGCGNWNAKQWGNDWQDPPDRRVVLRYHGYEQGSWNRIDGCKQHAQSLGTYVYGGEIMPEFGNGNYDDWGQNWQDCLDAGGHACAGWAITGGRDFRMNRGGDDARLVPELEAWTKKVGR